MATMITIITGRCDSDGGGDSDSDCDCDGELKANLLVFNLKVQVTSEPIIECRLFDITCRRELQQYHHNINNIQQDGSDRKHSDISL